MKTTGISTKAKPGRLCSGCHMAVGLNAAESSRLLAVNKNTVDGWRYRSNPVAALRVRETARDSMRRQRASGRRERDRIASARYRELNGDRVRALGRIYDAKRRQDSAHIEKKNDWRRRRLMADPTFRISCKLRTRISVAISRQVKGGKKFRSLEGLLGCTTEQFMAHIQSRFRPGMSWGNYGEWHIDHIKPCCSFDLGDEAQQIACFNFMNCQPLWASDNLSKNGRILS